MACQDYSECRNLITYPYVDNIMPLSSLKSTFKNSTVFNSSKIWRFSLLSFACSRSTSSVLTAMSHCHSKRFLHLAIRLWCSMVIRLTGSLNCFSVIASCSTNSLDFLSTASTMATPTSPENLWNSTIILLPSEHASLT